MISTNGRNTLATLPVAAIASLALAGSAPAAESPAAPANCDGKEKWGSGVWLNVVAEDVRSSEGLINVTVYADKRNKFLAKGGSLLASFFPAQKGETRACVFLPEAGVYAIAIYHDENANRKFDRNLLPTEGYGFSNNPSTLAGLPAWSSVRLNVSKTNLVTHIHMKYP